MPGPERIWYVGDAFENGFTLDEVHRLTHIDPWFLAQIKEIVADRDSSVDAETLEQRLDAARCAMLKRKGFSDRRLAKLFGTTEQSVREGRHGSSASGPCLQAGRYLRRGVRHRAPRTCTPPTRRSARPRRPTSARRSWSSAAGPTASARASSSTTAACTRRFALREDGFETIMINCNPETVSTDYDTSDRLYFEPLTLEDVLEIRDKEPALRRHRPVRRPDAAEAGARPRRGGRADHRHQRRLDRRRRGPRALPEPAAEAGSCCQPPNRTARNNEASDDGWPTKSGIRWWCARATCSAAAPWRSCTSSPSWSAT